MSTPAVTPQFTSQDFAARIRAKYPGAYDKIPDDELTQRVLTKYPQYQSQVANAGLAPPASPGIPQPLRQNATGTSPEGDWRQASREGTLKDLMLSQAAPWTQAAQQSGGFQGMVPASGVTPLASMVRQAGTGVGIAGKAAGWAEDFIPQFAKIHPGRALGRLSEAMKGFELAPKYGAPQVPDVPLTVQMGQAGRVAQRFGSPTSGAAMDEALPSAQRIGDIADRYQPRPAPAGRPSGARPPRPKLIDQMGGRPVEDISESDAAVKERMESSPEVQYGLNAKAHRGSGSKSYPEPADWQDTPEGYSPWNMR